MWFDADALDASRCGNSGKRARGLADSTLGRRVPRLSLAYAYSRRKCAVRCRWGVTRAGAWRVENAQQIEVGKTEKKGRESTTERGCQ